jgi:hypothetical protein
MNDSVSRADLEPVLAEFRSRPAVQNALVTLVQSDDFRVGSLQRSREMAAELLARLETELAR